MDIGAQLFTVRDYCKNLDDFAETLQKVADIGYSTVQVSGTCAYEPGWLKEQLAKTGLRCVLTHTSPDRIRDNPQQVAADHDVFGCHYIGIGCAPNCFNNGEEDWDALCRIIDAGAGVFAENGHYLMYHNHALEFQKSADGRTYFDRLLERYPAELVGFTLDTYWLQAAGITPPDFIRKLSGRVPCVHLKDMGVKGNEHILAPVGSGNMNFDAILAACADAGTAHLLVEQDHCYDEDPFVCLTKSYQFLKSRGF
ncbi:MAG: sugar phosphate isomerase/epimerase [Clostridia bacterium]|nr:sugar phosphate isomerase/epimerase [Clostridia bacterium]